MKLSTRFFLILLAFSMIPLMISGVWFLRSSRASQENARQFHLQMVRLAEDIVESYASDLNRALGFVTELERSAGVGDFHDEQKILQQASARNANFALLSVVGPDGKEVVRMADPEYFRTPGYEDRSADPLFQRAQQTGIVQIGQAMPAEPGAWLPVVHPLQKGYHLYVGYALKPLWRRVNSKSVGRSGRLLLLDAKGVPLPGIAEGFPAPHWADDKVLAVDEAWIDRVHTDAGLMVGALAQAPAFGWKILTLQPRTEAYAVSDKIVLQIVMFLLVVALFTAAGAYWMTGRITWPLNALIRGAQRAARQELDIAVPEVGWGELNILAKTFNEMMRTLWVYQEMQVERSLDEKARVEALVHTIPDGIMLSSFDGQIVYMNGSARSLMGLDGDTTGSLKGKNVGNVIRDPSLRQMALGLMGRKKVLDHIEIELKNSQGERQGVFSCRGVTVMQDKREVGILILLRDITAEKELDKMKDDFFHSIVHDLRNPLATIDGFIQLMQERSVSGAQVATYLRYVQESSEALKRLVTNILDAAKLESGTLTLNTDVFDVDAFMERMKAIYVLQAETHGVTVLFEIGGRLKAPFSCDRELIERVVINLMGNALKFTPKGGTIKLRVDAVNQAEYEFSVKDTGPGIPPDKLDFVFEKFKQLEGKKKAQGYGLGLSICKKVVELHGGRIWAESKPGDGSRFVFRLPLKQPAKA